MNSTSVGWVGPDGKWHSYAQTACLAWSVWVFSNKDTQRTRVIWARVWPDWVSGCPVLLAQQFEVVFEVQRREQNEKS